LAGGTKRYPVSTVSLYWLFDVYKNRNVTDCPRNQDNYNHLSLLLAFLANGTMPINVSICVIAMATLGFACGGFSLGALVSTEAIARI